MLARLCSDNMLFNYSDFCYLLINKKYAIHIFFNDVNKGTENQHFFLKNGCLLLSVNLFLITSLLMLITRNNENYHNYWSSFSSIQMERQVDASKFQIFSRINKYFHFKGTINNILSSRFIIAIFPVYLKTQ